MLFIKRTIKNTSLITFILIQFFLNACSTTPIHLTETQPTKITLPLHIMLPTLNLEQSIKRGGIMSHFETGYYLATKSRNVELLETIIPTNNNYPSIKSSSVTKLSKDVNGVNGACFSVEPSNKKATFCLLDTNKDGYFEQGVYQKKLIENLNAPYKINTTEVKSNYSEHLKKQLIYRGITVDKIKFTYLEFKGDMNKPNLIMDFTIGNHHGSHILFNYQGAHFKILKADNVNIIFESSAYLK